MARDKDITADIKAISEKPIADKKVSITFTENRKFELFIGKEQYTFMGAETKEIPVKYLGHPDFLQQQKYFTVKGV